MPAKRPSRLSAIAVGVALFAAACGEGERLAQARVDSLEIQLKQLAAQRASDSAAAALREQQLVAQRAADSAAAMAREQKRIQDSIRAELAMPRELALLQTKGTNLRPGDFGEYPFVLDRAGDCAIRGKVVATGGGKKDVQVLLLTDDDLVNWKNNPQSVDNPLFAGRVQTITNVEIPVHSAGRFHFVVSNTFSVLTSKIFEGEAVVTCTGGVQPRLG